MLYFHVNRIIELINLFMRLDVDQLFISFLPYVWFFMKILFYPQVSEHFRNSSFKVFADALSSDGGVIKAIRIPSGAQKYSNSALKKGDIYNEAIISGAKGLPFLKVSSDGNKDASYYYTFINWCKCFCNHQSVMH